MSSIMEEMRKQHIRNAEATPSPGGGNAAGAKKRRRLQAKKQAATLLKKKPLNKK